MQIAPTLEKGHNILLSIRPQTDFTTKEPKLDEAGNVLAKYHVVSIDGEETQQVQVRAPLIKAAIGQPVRFEGVNEFLYAQDGDKGQTPTRLSLSASKVKTGVVAS